MGKMCRCGKPAPAGQDWCKSCMEIRNREVLHCLVRIRMATRLELTSKETETLMQSYFERS